MRTSVIIALALGGAQAFQASAPAKAGTKLHAYVPSGMGKAEYEALKKKEADAKKKEELRRRRRARLREPVDGELHARPGAGRGRAFVSRRPGEGSHRRDPSERRAVHAARR